MKKFKTAILGNHLYTQFSIDDKLRNFLVDCGSDMSYIYFEPLGLEKTGEFDSFYSYDGRISPTEKCVYNRDVFHLCDKPGVIRHVEEDTGVDIAGVVGLDFLIRNKIVLDFGKMK
jgi:hypothetical protein